MEQERPSAISRQAEAPFPRNGGANDPPNFPLFESPDQVMAYAILTVGIRWHLAGLRQEAGRR